MSEPVVLVVDDDRANLESVARIFQKEGVATLTATAGQEALEVREARADKLLAFDDAVVKVVAQLKEKGLTSPYLKNFVVARVNFLRFVKGDKVPDFDEAIDKMTASVGKIDPGSVKKEDLARMGGAPAEADEE